MAWTTPRTWVAGEVLTAALMNTHVRDNENVVKVSIRDDGHLFDSVVQTKGSTGYSIAITDDWVIFSSGSPTATLPTAIGSSGRQIHVKNISTGLVTMACAATSQSIDSTSPGSTILLENDSYYFESNGADWLIV